MRLISNPNPETSAELHYLIRKPNLDDDTPDSCRCGAMAECPGEKQCFSPMSVAKE